MEAQPLTIYRVTGDGVTRFRYLSPAQVSQLRAQGFKVEKVRDTE